MRESIKAAPVSQLLALVHCAILVPIRQDLESKLLYNVLYVTPARIRRALAQ